MRKFDIKFTDEARQDILDLAQVIILEYKAPLTAERYVRDLYGRISDLGHQASSIAVSNNPSVLKFGFNARRINYKKIAIIYIIRANEVIICKIIPSSMIK